MSHNILLQKRLTQKQCEQYEFMMKIGKQENFTESSHQLLSSDNKVRSLNFSSKRWNSIPFKSKLKIKILPGAIKAKVVLLLCHRRSPERSKRLLT